MLKLIFSILLLASFTIVLHAQDSLRLRQDSARSPRRSFDSSLFSENTALTRSDYLVSIEKAFQVFNKAPVVIESFSNIDFINERLRDDDSALSIIKERLTQNDRSLSLRNLQMFYVLLEQMNNENKSYSKELEEYDNRMDALKKEIREMRKDTVIRYIFRDSVLRASFKPQLEQLRSKFKNTDSLIRWGTTTINNLKAHSSANIISTQELLYSADNQAKTAGPKAFSKERRYLWEPRTSTAPRNNSIGNGFRKSVAAEKNIARYYFSHTRNQRNLLVITGLIFFVWVFYNFRSLKRLGKISSLNSFKFRYVNPIPIMASLVFMLSLAPLFDLDAPAIYIESIGFLLMLTLTAFLWRYLPKTLFFFWGLFVILFLLLTFSRLLGLPFSLQRYWTVTINASAVALGLIVLLRYKNQLSKHKVITAAAGLYILFNLIAIICNAFGRTTLSQILGSTAIYAFLQVVSLSIFIQLVTEACLLQIQASRMRKSYPESFDSDIIKKNITRFVSILAVIIWLVVFTTNMNLYTMISAETLDILKAPRSIGSISFTIGGMILFLVIIWAANFLQKYIAFFLGDTGDEAAFDNKGQRSKLLITRLVLLTCGFLLAIAASGLPLDKITVILGALGVGIGLGLQSIVNNFVSGIILIFDRPLRIGDIVEIGDKKGRVKEIGIRSSTLLTADGAEVIIPNGDVLSHNIVNWTLSNNHIRMELSYKITKPQNAEEIVSEIDEILKKNENILPGKNSEILIRAINAKSSEVKIYFWCKDVRKTEFTQSDVASDVQELFDKKEIEIL